MDKQDKLKRKLQQTQAQLILLNEHINAGGGTQGVLDEDLEEISALLEELSVSEEELRVQNEELESAQLAVENERARYLDLFEFAPDGYLLTEKFGVIREANQAMCRMLNTPAARLAGKPLAVFIHKEDKKEFRKRLNNIESEEKVENWVLRVEPKNGHTISARVKITVKHKPGEESFQLFWMFHNITDLLEMTERLRESEANLKTLSNDLVDRIENEKMRLAMDLHDHIGQMLTSLNLSIRPNILLNKPPEQQEEILDITRQQISEILDSVADLSLRLRPQILDDLGLGNAIYWHAKQVGKQTGSFIHFENMLEDGQRLDPIVEIALFRIVEEALANALKHANANAIHIKLEKENGQITLTISDDGVGFDPAATLKHFDHSGLTGMKERVSHVRGTLRIDSKPAGGTTIVAAVPVGDEAD